MQHAVASTLGILGAVARKYAHKIPFIVKLNHNEMLSYPNFYDQTMFASVEQAFDMGAAAVGATIYFGSVESGARSRRSARPSNWPTNWGWLASSGVTCAIPPSRRSRGICTPPPTLPARPTIWE